MDAKQDLRKGIDDALAELEKVADEVRVKLHLAGMDVIATWNEQLEPRLFEARQHARDASLASKAAIAEAVETFREFARAI